VKGTTPFYATRWFLIAVVAAALAAGGLYYIGVVIPARDARQARAEAADLVEAILKRDLDAISGVAVRPEQAEPSLDEFISSKPEWQARSVTRKVGSDNVSLEATLADGKVTQVIFEKTDSDNVGQFFVTFRITSDGSDEGQGRVYLISPKDGKGWRIKGMEFQDARFSLLR